METAANARPTAPAEPALKRELGLASLTLAGVGTILGAGIYVLVGEAVAEAGALAPLAFLLAAVTAACTGLSYAELGAMFPRAGAAFEYSRQAFGRRSAFVTGWLTTWGAVIAAAAVALGFGSYAERLLGVDQVLAALALLAAGTGIAATGVLGSMRIVIVLTILEAAGLIAVTSIGFATFDADAFATDGATAAGVLSGAALVFFAYIGFEDIAAFAEEAREPERNVPRAIIIAIAVTATIYMLVCIASIGAIGVEELAGAPAPLAEVAAIALDEKAGDAIASIGMAATANTALLMVMAATRRVFAMAREGVLPSGLVRVPRSGVPVSALLLVAGLAALPVFTGDIGEVADTTNVLLFLAFTMVHLSLIRLRWTNPETPRPFMLRGSLPLPGNRRLPFVPLVGLVTLAMLLPRTGAFALTVGAGVLVAGIVAALLLLRERD